MFGKNKILKSEQHLPGHSLRVVAGSPFRTIQGEGPFAGYPAVFLRLHGCNLACTFCDTNFDDPNDQRVYIEPLSEQIINLFGSEFIKLLVITGGEPLRQNIVPLIERMHNKLGIDFIVQIETAGTLWLDNLPKYVHIVCSPKTPVIHPKIYERALAFKYVIDCEDEHEGYIPITATQAGARKARLAAPNPETTVYLSPMDTYNEERNRKNRLLVAELALKYGVRAGLQMHKFMELD